MTDATVTADPLGAPRDFERQRSILRQSFYAFAQMKATKYGKGNLMTEEVHKPLCDWVQDNYVRNSPRLSLRDPRNHIKSTLAADFVEWVGIQTPDMRYDSPAEVKRAREYLWAHPHIKGANTRILYASSSDKNALRKAGAIKRDYEQHTMLRYYFPECRPENLRETELTSPVWRKTEFTIPSRTLDYTEPFVDTGGVGTRSTGRHYDIIIFDDPIDEKNYNSEVEVEAAKEWLRLAQFLLEVADPTREDSGLIMVVGNKWTFWDVQTMIDEEWTDVYNSWHRSAWVCSHCGRGHCVRGPECMPTDEPLWPERWTREGLYAVRDEIGDRLFAAQYENNPMAGESTAFRSEWLRYFTWDDTGRWITVSPTQRWELRDLRAVISVDPATSRDPKSCNTSIAVLGEHMQTGDVFLLDLVVGKFSPKQNVEQILNTYERWKKRGLRIAHIGVEVVAGQAFIAPALISSAERRDVYIQEPRGKDDSTNLLQYYKTDTHMTKEDRIINLIGWRFENGKFYVYRGLPHRTAFEAEYVRFPLARSTDIIDSIAYAEQIYQRKILDRRLVKKQRVTLRHKALRERMAG